ncbi:MAG: radical SAM protein [Candidatus Zixiibacteriota bacterium]
MFLYGPVLSRRLGYSLGVDVVKPKCCSLDCIYCQLGSQKACKPKRSRFFPPEKIEKALDKKLKNIDKLDYITFAGSGEPTLSKDLGRFIRFLKEKYPKYKVAVLTNSTLLHYDEVIEELLPCDLIVPSLDATNQKQFGKINRPHKDIRFEDLITGLQNLRQRFIGEIRLEVMIIKGVNDDDDSLQRFAEIAQKINPDSIDINTPVRPPAEEWVEVPDSERIEKAENLLKASIITRKAGDDRNFLNDNVDELSNFILTLLERRPETRETLAQITNLSLEVIDKHLIKLIALDKIYKKLSGDKVFYIAK